ncbi:unnamed protein product [Lymnaea stagnalis]|uniref:Uncharacterized protein n=1 Tax=Lymnaea stagnalis TaxID=6523 RepID=A0AAV2I3F2_LYMST
MDWRHPNAKALFMVEKNKPSEEPGEHKRYARFVRNAPLYGLCTRDFERDHRPVSWPPGTEYQYAYCSNYRGLLPPIEDTKRRDWSQCETQRYAPKPPEHPLYKLYEQTPLPLLDKHYRGAQYLPDDPLGVQVPEELTRCRELVDGSHTMIGFMEHLGNEYTPNYRYKDWIGRPLTEITRELEANHTLYCHLPAAPTSHWDFYNVVRMRRPAKQVSTDPLYRRCRVMPIPADTGIPNLLETGELFHAGRLINYGFTDTPFQGHANKTAVRS